MKVTNKPKEKTEDEHGTEMSNWMRARENNGKQRISWTSKDWSNFIFCYTFFLFVVGWVKYVLVITKMMELKCINIVLYC